MKRRHCLLLFPALLCADERQDIVDWLGALVQRLTEENASEFLRALDKTLHDRLSTAIWALVRNHEVASSITVLSITEEGPRRKVDLDWFLYLKPRSPNASTIERRERITMTLLPAKKGWQVQSLSPESFFAPPQNG